MTVADSQTHLPGRLLTNRNFILLWSAYAISALGDHLSEMAILQTQDALSKDVDVTPIFARMTFMLFIPFLLLGPFAGLLADRLPRRGIMVAADVVRCGIMLVFGTLIEWTSRFHPQWGPVAPIFLVGIFAALFSPARAAMVPALIRPTQLIRANGLIAGMGIISTFLSLKLGGWLADRGTEPAFTFQLDAATFAASALLLLAMRPPPQHAARRADDILASGLQQLRVGFQYARTHRSVLEMLIIAGVVWFCGALVKSSVPAVVRDVYAGTYGDIGDYMAFLGGGMIAGAIGMAVVGDALRGEVGVTWGLIGIALSMGVFSASVFLPYAPVTLGRIGAVGILGGGFFGVVAIASFNALIQRIVPDRFRGRVFGVKDLVTTAALLAATGALGLPQWQDVDRWVGWILAGVALVTLATGLITLEVRLRRSPHGRVILFFEHLIEFIARFWWRMTITGGRIPRHGAVLIAPNHTCYPDPIFVIAAAPHRIISFLVAAEYVHLPIVRYFLRKAECIPVRRDGRDAGPTREVMRRLRDGKAIGIFIEGRIVPPGQESRPRDGLAMLALRTGAPVIPVHISGTRYSKHLVGAFLTRHRVRIHIGRPVDLSEFAGRERERTAVREATEKIFAAIGALAPRVAEG